MFTPTAAPFSSMARRIAASPTGTSPRCQARPSSKVFIAWALPNSFSARPTPCSHTERPASVTFSMVRRCIAASIDSRASRLKSAVAARSRLPITTDVRALRSSTPAPQDTARSAASIRSAPPIGMRTTSRSDSEPAICTCATTAPFFCAMPVKSSVLTAFPSICAAIARMAPAVTMPPPPIPANNPRQTPRVGSVGSGRQAANSASRFCHDTSATGALGAPGSVTKLGQNPFRQDRSTLQLVGLMRRLRPRSVSTGSIAMQLDCTEQSPQFSQTASLMTTCRAALAIDPRLRRRRFSVAQT